MSKTSEIIKNLFGESGLEDASGMSWWATSGDIDNNIKILSANGDCRTIQIINDNIVYAGTGNKLPEFK